MNNCKFLIDRIDAHHEITKLADMASDELLEIIKDKIDPRVFEDLENYIMLVRKDRDIAYDNLKYLAEVSVSDNQSIGEA